MEMTPGVRDFVDRRWAEYGIPLDPSAGNGRIRQSFATPVPNVTSLTGAENPRLNPDR
jgi:hypothetical protein